MSKKYKLILKGILISFLFLAIFYSAEKVLADNQEPILIEIHDTDIGTAAFEQLISYGNGGHAAMGAILGDAQNMLSNPGIGFSIGSGGNGYRPSILIAVWTDQPFNPSTGLATIKNYFNVPVNPVTTNGDCLIACDGTVQSEPVVQSVPEPVQQIVQSVVQQPVSIQQPEPQQQIQQLPVVPDSIPQYTIPTVSLEALVSYITPADIIVQSPISNKIIFNKKSINKNKITTKKVRIHATNKTTR
jgi:hypothetical protein